MTMKTTYFILTALTLLCCLSCSRTSATNPVVNAEARARTTNAPVQNMNARIEQTPAPAPKFPELFSFEASTDVFTVDNFSERDDDNRAFAFGGFTFANQNKNVLIEDDEAGHKFQEVRSDIIVTKNGRVVRRFEGLSYGAGVATRFGTFSFLGDERQQVVIEQTIHRGEYYRVLDVTANELSTIYEGGGYIFTVDLDKDGVMEIVTEIKTFRFFYQFSNVNSPFSTAVYKYDVRAKKYILANRTFADYVLRDVDANMRRVNATRPTGEQQKEPVQSGSGLVPDHKFPDYLSAVVSVMIDRIYVGEETDAWTFFEREYNLSDKDMLRKKIKEQLAGDEIYRTLYRR